MTKTTFFFFILTFQAKEKKCFIEVHYLSESLCSVSSVHSVISTISFKAVGLFSSFTLTLIRYKKKFSSCI